MLHRRVYQFFIIYGLGLALLLGIKYALNLSNYVIPGPAEIWMTCREESRRYFSDVMDTMSVAIIGQILSIGMAGFIGIVGRQTPGCTRGHSAAADAFSVAAVDVATASGGPFVGGATNPVELFSCDGPRRIFFDATGNLLPGAPAGDFSSTGGVVRQKPDVAAADGVAVATPGFNPFFGTSAAAPHAAAIAALVKAAFPAFTAAQVRTALKGSALDIEAPGVDRDSGSGIVMAYETLADNGAAPQAFLARGAIAPSEVAGDGDSNLESGEDWSLSIPLTNMGGAGASAISATLTTSTPGVAILSGSSTYPDLAVSASAPSDSPYVIGLQSNFSCGTSIDLTLTVTYSGGASPQAFDVSLSTGSPGTPASFSYSGPVVAIPDGGDLSGTNPGAPANADLAVSGVSGGISDANFSLDGTTCTNAAGATTVGLDHSFVSDLKLILRSPSGTEVMVVDQTDGSGNNFCQTVLDDQSAGPSIQSVASSDAPFTGSFKPNAALSAFAGEDPNGTWQLQAQDFYSFDTGNIRAFTVDVTPAVCDAAAVGPAVTATKEITGGDLKSGGSVIYTVTLTNNGTGGQPDNAGDELSDMLPPGLTVGTPSASSGTVSGPGVNPVTWNGPILAGGSVTITIPATIAGNMAGQTISNQGTVSFDADRNGSNESSALTDVPGGGADEPTEFVALAASVVDVPALSGAALALLALLLAAAAALVLRRMI